MDNDMNENYGVINFIMLGRIYDVLMLVADALGKGEDALKLHQMHSQGQLMSPFPSLAPAVPEEPESLDEQN